MIKSLFKSGYEYSYPDEVSHAIVEKRTMGRQDVLRAMDIAENGREVIIFVKNPNGQEQKLFGIRTKDQTIPVQSHWLT